MKTAKGRITILTDNTVPGKSHAVGEHGFSAFLETENGNFLFDTGRGKSIVYNALIYKKDLRTINKIVLSHSHHDHTGGLPDVLKAQVENQIDVFSHPDIFVDRFREINGKRTYGGIPFTKGHLERLGARFVFNKEYVAIEDGIFLTGEVPRETSFEGGDMGGRFVIREGRVEPDIILDDQSLVIHTKKGILIVLGCAHAGMVNIINHAIKMSGVDTIYGIIGGTHIDFSGNVQLEKSIEALKDYKIEQLIPSHCTGLEATFRLKMEFEKTFRFSYVGLTLDF